MITSNFLFLFMIGFHKFLQYDQINSNFILLMIETLH